VSQQTGLELLDKTRSLAMFPGKQDAGDRRMISREAAIALINWAKQYGLDAWSGHCCYMYGQPYIEEKGVLYHANHQKTYRGYITIPIKEVDYAELGYPDAISIWECTVFLGGDWQPIREWGVVDNAEIMRLRRQVEVGVRKEHQAGTIDEATIQNLVTDKLSYLPLCRYPSTQARTRAIRRAHLKAYPFGPPEAEIEPEP